MDLERGFWTERRPEIKIDDRMRRDDRTDGEKSSRGLVVLVLGGVG